MTEKMTLEEFFAPRLAAKKDRARRTWNIFCIRKNRLRVLLAALIVALLGLYIARYFQATAMAKAAAEQAETARIAALQEAERAEAMRATATPEPAPDPMQIEAETVARVLYGTARNNTRDQQEAVVWCIINRMESALYPDTIEGVCRQEGQWMGYSDSNPIMEDLYQTAYGVLEDYYGGGHRIVPPEMLWLSWDPDQITLRDDFSEKPGTKYWRA